tara:strand:+ start:45413 stop:47017 length:1605 start_codon:yes stop_codon:yes gene_type:complete
LKLLKPLFAFIFLIASNLVFIERVLDMVSRQRWVSLIIYLGIWGICVTSFALTLFHENKVIQVFGGMIMAISTAFGMSYLNIGGHFLNYMDMELLWISRGHAMKALLFYIDHLYFPVLIALIGFISGFLPGHIEIRKKGLKLLANLMILIPFPLLAGLTFVKAGYGTVGMPQQYSAVSTFLLLQGYERVSEGMVEAKRPIRLKPTEEAWSKNILFIVDESIRHDYLDINEDKKITPFLKSIEDQLVNFGKASSSNNCSGYSNAVLRMGGIRGKLSKIGSNPFIWSYAKEAGYTTWYLDAQLKHGELQNFMTEEELQSIDHFVQLDKVEEAYLDQSMISEISKILNNGKKNFIYFNKRGAHFPYTESYVTEKAPFLPQMEKGDVLGDSKEKLVNSYKNAIWWNTDEFFKILFKIDLSESFVFYTSDHGQNLMDRGIQTHCNTEEPHHTEGMVPIFLIPNEKRKNEITKWTKTNFNKTNHFQIFPTILFTMGYSPLEVIKEYGEGLNQRPTSPQEFSAGPVLPKFGKGVDWNTINP